ncbi:phage tail protein [Kribbella sp. NPDC003557]|uniref:phage tail protein n=1 Tax=Kribbella sp. NPDC003557 TaxID=3154449 RepID=UPI0033BA6EAD
MRGTTTELETPYPLGSLLPAVLQEDELLMRFTAAVDLLLAPAINTVDCLAAYVDPGLAPPDHLGWLAGWVGAELNETWPLETQRAAIQQAVHLHRGRGTVEGMRLQLALVLGADVRITDSGGVTWSVEPVDDLADDRPALVEVVARSNSLRVAEVEAAVDAAKPAHVAHSVRVESVSGGM